MLQRLLRAIAHVKADKPSESLLNAIHQIKKCAQKRLWQYNAFNKRIIQTGYYIYEF